MSTFWFTVTISIVLCLICLFLLAIGLIFTGKIRLKRGCGVDPNKCGKNKCDLCQKDKEDEDEDADNV